MMIKKQEVIDMQKWLEKGFMLGLGAFALTKEKADKLINQIVNQGEYGQQEAEELVDKLMKKGEEEKEFLNKMMNDQINKTIKDLKLVSLDDYNSLLQRVEELENQIANKDK